MNKNTFEKYVKEFVEDLAIKDNPHQYVLCRIS